MVNDNDDRKRFGLLLFLLCARKEQSAFFSFFHLVELDTVDGSTQFDASSVSSELF